MSESRDQREDSSLKEWGALKVQRSVAAALADMGYQVPSQIQEQAIPLIQQGRDVVGQAVTGSGKTAAFGIPAVEKVNIADKFVQVVILVPTRELAQQVAKEIKAIGAQKSTKTAVIYGGEPIMKQFKRLNSGVHIVVGTPGRVMDHMQRGSLNLGRIRMAVLDEADEMLDIGFADDMETILRTTPRSRQTALFSATIPGFIFRLIRRYLYQPSWVKLSQASQFDSIATVDNVRQVYYEVAEQDKFKAADMMLSDMDKDAHTLIFRRTQIGVERMAAYLGPRYHVRGLHGRMNQSERNSIMETFRLGKVRTLVATNLAARGLDIPSITHVINSDMPGTVEEYVHRIGRTARMGKQGQAITFVSQWDYDMLEKIQRKVGKHKLERGILSLYSQDRKDEDVKSNGNSSRDIRSRYKSDRNSHND